MMRRTTAFYWVLALFQTLIHILVLFLHLLIFNLSPAPSSYILLLQLILGTSRWNLIMYLTAFSQMFSDYQCLTSSYSKAQHLRILLFVPSFPFHFINLYCLITVLCALPSESFCLFLLHLLTLSSFRFLVPESSSCLLSIMKIHLICEGQLRGHSSLW